MKVTMNTRIQDLARQANLQPYYDSQEIAIKKFAELIVNEMASVLDKAQWDKGEDWICADGTPIIQQVKNHFGDDE